MGAEVADDRGVETALVVAEKGVDLRET